MSETTPTDIPASSTAQPPEPDANAPAPPPGPLSRLLADRPRLIAALSTATSILLLGTVVATLAVGLPQLRSRASEIRKAGRPVQVAFAWPPLAGQGPHRPPASATTTTDHQTWVNAEIRRDVESVAKRLLSDDPLDTASLVAARDALLGTGWFNADLRLIRGDDNIVRVSGSWKVPAAAVRIDGPGPTGGGLMDQLISSAGELLPPRYPVDRSGMKVVLGVTAKPPAPGQPFPGPEVQAGLRLLSFVSTLRQSEQIVAVDVSEYAVGKSLTLVTELGNKIVWGGGVDEFSPGQPPARVKLARLAEVAVKHGRLDAGRPLIDVRMTDGVYVRDVDGLLSAAEAAAQQAQADDAKNQR